MSRPLLRPGAVLLDRDGTLNVKAPEGDYVRSPDELVLLDDAAAGVRALNAAGIPVYVVTNQRGVARGLMSLADLDAVHARLIALLGAAGARVDGIYACPHPGGDCDCRKPAPGLVHRIVGDHPDVDPRACAVVGDAPSDVALARAVGALAVRVAPAADPLADLTATTVGAAVAALLALPVRPIG